MPTLMKRNLTRAAVLSTATALCALPAVMTSSAFAATPSATANSYTTANGTVFSVDKVTDLKEGDTIKLTVSSYTPPTDKSGFYVAYGPDASYSYLDASVYPSKAWVSKKMKNEPQTGGSNTIDFTLTSVKDDVSDCTQTACSLYVFSAHGGKDRTLDARIRLHLADEKDSSDNPPKGFVAATVEQPAEETQPAETQPTETAQPSETAQPAETQPADTSSSDSTTETDEPDLGFFASISAIFSTIFNLIIGVFKSIFGIFGF